MSVPAALCADGERHPWVDSWCDYLSRVIVGRAAAGVLEGGVPASAGLVVLPSWLWLFPRIDVGRKGRAADGGRLLLPIRVDWDPSPVVLVTGRVEVGWVAVGMGFDRSGVCVLEPGGGGWDPVWLSASDRPPAMAVVPVLSDTVLRRALVGLVEDGEAALWAAATSLEEFVERAVERAHSYISMDVAGGSVGAPALLDRVALGQVRDEMLVGTETVRSPLLRLVERSLDPLAFVRVDPQRVVAMSVNRDAQQAVRRAVGDPKNGSKIRAVARLLGLVAPFSDADVQAVLGRYRELYPRERMGAGRVSAALRVRPSSSVLASPIPECGLEDRGWGEWRELL